MLWASIGRMPGLFFTHTSDAGQLAVRIMRGKSYPRTLDIGFGAARS